MADMAILHAIRSRKKLAILAIACGFAAATASAADEKRKWDLELGMGAAYEPNYSGASAAAPRLLLWANGAYRTENLGTFALDSGSLTIAPEIRWDVINSPEVGVGPLVGYRPGRDDSNPRLVSANDGSNRLRGLPNVSAAFDVGAAGHVTVFGAPLFAQARAALNGSQGGLLNLGMYLPFEPTSELELTVLPTITWANARQMRASYGVNPTAAMASGFPIYDPGAGWENAAVEIGGDWRFSGAWHLVASVAYQRLLGNAAHSPIVQTANQPSALLGIALHF